MPLQVLRPSTAPPPAPTGAAGGAGLALFCGVPQIQGSITVYVTEAERPRAWEGPRSSG